MRARRLALLLGAAFVFGGCGDRNLVLNVDVKSFLTESQSKASIGPVPVVLGGLFLGEQKLVDDLTVNLLDGVSGVVEVRDVSVRLRTAFHDSTGEGSDTLKVYVSDENTDPMSTAPALVQDALRSFRRKDGWKVGVDGSVALITLGVGGSIDTNQIRQPVIGFILDEKGLMYNLTLEGSKISRISR